MKYKGYTGIVEYDEESQVLCGRVIGLRDVITFEGDSGPEVTQAFQDSVDDYLAFCAERGESPEKPYSGQFVLRLDPRLHRELANVAQEKDTSLNALIEAALWRSFLPDVRERPSKAAPVVARIAAEPLPPKVSGPRGSTSYKVAASSPRSKSSAFDAMVGRGSAKPGKKKNK
jgi:predicted HicB family RNase H-like nuclease